MLEYTDFKDIVLDEIKKKFNRDGFNVSLEKKDEVALNERRDKVIVTNSSSPDAFFPVFYLENVYSYYKKCGDLYLVIDELVNDIKREYKNLPDVDMTREGLEDNLFFSLINRDKNDTFLQTHPHRDYLDMAIIYRIKVSDTSNIIVTDKIMNKLNISENELYNMAYKNTPTVLGNICRTDVDTGSIKNIKKMLSNMSVPLELMEDNDEAKIFVYKYEKSNSFAPSIILYKDELEKASDRLKDDLLISFPTTDEMIVTTASNDFSEVEFLFEGNKVPQKYLSDNQYIYDKDAKEIYVKESENLNKNRTIETEPEFNAKRRSR